MLMKCLDCNSLCYAIRTIVSSIRIQPSFTDYDTSIGLSFKKFNRQCAIGISYAAFFRLAFSKALPRVAERGMAMRMPTAEVIRELGMFSRAA